MIDVATHRMTNDLARLAQIGLSIWAQSGVTLFLVLMAGAWARTRGAALQALVYRWALIAVALLAVLGWSLGSLTRPLVRITLPPPTSPAPVLAEASAPMRAAAALPPLPVPAEKSFAFVSTARFYAAQLFTKDTLIGGKLTAATKTINRAQTGTLYFDALALWLGGAALGWGFLLIGLLAIARLRRGAQPVTTPAVLESLAVLSEVAGIRPPKLFVHRRVTTPFVAGIPGNIFLPPTLLDGLSPGEINIVLAHEVTHVAARDTGWNLLFLAVQALLWPQPLAWLLRRQWQHASEDWCDLWVVEQARICMPADYANCLLRIARGAQRGGVILAVGMVVPVRSNLARRVARVLDRTQCALLTLSRAARLTCAVAAVAAACASVLLVSASTTYAQDGKSNPAYSSRVSAYHAPLSRLASQAHAQNLGLRSLNRVISLHKQVAENFTAPLSPSPAVLRAGSPCSAPMSVSARSAYLPHSKASSASVQRISPRTPCKSSESDDDDDDNDSDSSSGSSDVSMSIDADEHDDSAPCSTDSAGQTTAGHGAALAQRATQRLAKATAQAGRAYRSLPDDETPMSVDTQDSAEIVQRNLKPPSAPL